MKIGVIADCKARSIASAVSAFIPGADVSFWYLGNVRAADADSRFAPMSKCDILLASGSKGEYDTLMTAGFKPGQNLLVCPLFEFMGLQPDQIVFRPELVAELPPEGPMGPYHSLICAAGYVCGMSANDISSLYGEDTYDRLGFFEMYDAGRSYWIDTWKPQGFDFEGCFAEWEKSGRPYMWTVNHPRAIVAIEIVRRVLSSAGVAIQSGDVSDNVIDDLGLSYSWPVYPEIASRHGMRGHTFLRPVERLGSRILPIETFIEESLVAYKGISPSILEAHPRVKEAVLLLR
jgi:hypothetical protein